MHSARGGMGSHKHGVSGTPGPNRRMLQSLGRFVSRLWPRRRRRVPLPFKSVCELMDAEAKR